MENVCCSKIKSSTGYTYNKFYDGLVKLSRLLLLNGMHAFVTKKTVVEVYITNKTEQENIILEEEI